MYLYISGLKGRKQILTRLRLNPPWMSRGTLSRCIPPDFRGVMRCYQGLNSFSPTFHLNFLTFFLQFFPFLINIPLFHLKLSKSQKIQIFKGFSGEANTCNLSESRGGCKATQVKTGQSVRNIFSKKTSRKLRHISDSKSSSYFIQGQRNTTDT